MSKSLLFIGMLFLGASMIISSLILSKSIVGSKQLSGNLNGSFTMSNSNKVDSDILTAYDAEVMIGYDQNALIQDIVNGKLEGLPFIQVGDHYVFSKKALEEWLYNRASFSTMKK